MAKVFTLCDAVYFTVRDCSSNGTVNLAKLKSELAIAVSQLTDPMYESNRRDRIKQMREYADQLRDIVNWVESKKGYFEIQRRKR